MDAASQQWATVEGAVDNLDIHENAGDADEVRDKSIDAAAPTSAVDDNDDWGQRQPGGPATRQKNTAKAAAAAAAAERIEHDPVPVHVGNDPLSVTDLAADDWSVTAAPNVATVPSAVVGRHETRRGLLLVNTGSVTVYVAPNQSVLSVSAANGFPIAPAGTLSIDTRGAVWAATAAGAGSLAVVATYDLAETP